MRKQCANLYSTIDGNNCILYMYNNIFATFALINYSSPSCVPTDNLPWLNLVEENKISDYCDFFVKIDI